MSNTISITLNTRDDEGNIVDTHDIDLTREQISDIIDHAADVVMLSDTLSNFGNDKLKLAMDELGEALEVPGVI